MYNLFLDDTRGAHEPATYMPSKVRFMYLAVDWIVARSHKEFVAIITERGLPNLISFDHDLADEHYYPIEVQDNYEYDEEFWRNFYSSAYKEETGYSSAQWLVDYCMDNALKLPEYLVHTQNPVGKENIHSLLSNFKKYQNQQDEQNKTQCTPVPDGPAECNRKEELG